MTLTQSSPEPTSYLNLVHSDTETGTDHPAPSAITHPNEATSHLLRLVLDLQLDALLLTVAGSGIEAATGSPCADQTPESLPWRRWAAEDGAVARGLCEETV